MPNRFLPLLLAPALLGGCVMKSTFDREAGLYDAERQVNAQLEAEIKADHVEIKQLKDRLRITFADDILFPESGWEVTTPGKAVLDKLVNSLINAKDSRIQVDGHTDNVPIGKNLRGRFPTNWELSCARAAEVVKYLQSQGINPSRLTAAGHGEYQPVKSNATAVGRQANRRTDLYIMPPFEE